jgi:hypothetical protein
MEYFRGIERFGNHIKATEVEDLCPEVIVGVC